MRRPRAVLRLARAAIGLLVSFARKRFGGSTVAARVDDGAAAPAGWFSSTIVTPKRYPDRVEARSDRQIVLLFNGLCKHGHALAL
jgi:hypothetical protein